MERWRYAPHAAVAVLAAGLYLSTLRFGFVLDDKHLIVDNTFVREAWSPWRAFAHDFWHGSSGGALYYRPVVNASLALNGRILGWGPAGFHLVNVLLHALNSVLVLVLARRLGAGRRAALAAGTLMAIHPAAAWAVASIVARVDLLPATFVLLAWLAHREGHNASRASSGWGLWRRPLLTGASFLGALLSKESAVAFLVVPLLGLRRMRGEVAQENRPPAGRAELPVVAACGLAVALALVLRRLAGAGLSARWGDMEPFLNPLAGAPFPDRLYGAVRLSGRYLLYLIAPFRFSDPTDYAAGIRPDAAFVLGGLGLLAAGAGIVRLWVRRDPLSLPLAFSLAAFLPASNLLVPIASIYALNFLYMPLVGASLAAGILLSRVVPDPASRGRLRPVRLLPALGVTALLVYATTCETRIWRDGETLARSWIDRFPHYAFARGSLGVALLDRGLPGAAIAPLRQALSIDDRSAETRYNLGVALLTAARDDAHLEEALRATRGALDLDPGYVEARVNASRILLRLKRPAEAETEARAALERAPGLPVARLNLAEAMFRQSRTEEAEAEFRGLLRDAPGDPRLLSSYLLFLIDSGQTARARTVSEEARRDFPDVGWFDFCLARIEAASGRPDAAIALLRSAVAKDPQARSAIAATPEFGRLRGRADFEELAGP